MWHFSMQRLALGRIPVPARASNRRCYSTRINDSNSHNNNNKKLLLMDANGVIYKRVQKKFLKLKEWIIQTKKYDNTQLPNGSDEETLDKSVDSRIRDELKVLRKAANQGKVSSDVYYRKVLELHKVDPVDYDKGLQAIRDAEFGIRLFEGIEPALKELKLNRGVKLGIITDSMSSTSQKLEWIRRQGMDPAIFDFIVNSCEVGATKPDRRMYESAMELARPLGIEGPHQAAFVGHKTAELLGAKSFGITTITFNPDEDLKERLGEFDYNVNSWAEIPQLHIFPPVKEE